MASDECVKVRKHIVSCFSCPLCSNLFREATTIIECLHTFCKDCIYKKFEDDKTCCCPLCNVYLGCIPRQKLRPDYNLQELRMKIFPCKYSEVSDGISTSLPPQKRKKRFQSNTASSSLKRLMAQRIVNAAKQYKAKIRKQKRKHAPFDQTEAAKELQLGSNDVNECLHGGYRSLHPVWLALVASKDQSHDALPQIPKPYIRIRDGNITVSYINKFLAQKLDLSNESEVELRCCGLALLPDATIRSLGDIWVQNSANRDEIPESLKSEVLKSVNSLEFVVILTYRRRLGSNNDRSHEQ